MVGTGTGTSKEKTLKGKHDQHPTAKGKTEEHQVQVKSNSTNSSKKRKEVFPFGNYRNYYGYRINQNSDEDPRLKVMKKDWFEGKTCLDIGCNSGIITIHIAKKFHCESILGIDIDENRIADACWNIRNLSRVGSTAKNGAKRSRADMVAKDKGLELSVKSEEQDLSKIVFFRQENFVQSPLPQGKCYDTILCLSVAKWIHLNWGDDGLMTLFSKIWKLLRPGGYFILEPQPWKSYENNRKVSETTAMNYRKILLRPDHFREILLDKVGFRTVEDITSSLSGSNAGFDRQILVFQK